MPTREGSHLKSWRGARGLIIAASESDIADQDKDALPSPPLRPAVGRIGGVCHLIVRGIVVSTGGQSRWIFRLRYKGKGKRLFVFVLLGTFPVEAALGDRG
jgi:hypothetical protein